MVEYYKYSKYRYFIGTNCMNWKENRSRIVLLMILSVASVVMLIGTIANPGHISKSSLNVVEPVSVEKTETGGSILRFEVDKNIGMQSTLAFLSSHQFVHAYGGDEELYSLTQTGGAWGHTTGNVWNFVVIPEDVTSIEVRLEPCYPEVKDYQCTYYWGMGRQIYTGLMIRSVLPLAISLLIAVIGCYILIYWLIVKRNSDVDETLFYLGIFSIILGFWSANETDAVTLLFENRIVASFNSFAFLMIMGIPFALFVRDFLQMGDKKIWRTFCNLSLIEMLICSVLHFTGIFELRRSVIFTHIILVFALFYLIGCMIYKVIKKQVDKRLKISMLGLVFIILATVVDLISYYFVKNDSDVFGRVSFLLFIIVLGVESAKQTIITLQRGRRAKELEQFALNDTMTGFYNRNAYDHYVQTEKAPYHSMLITFDLNDLKKCNDVRGHAAGDKYIISAANVIEEVFGKYGKCYRIGGDEFCCVIKNGTDCPIQRLIQKVDQGMTFLNNQNILPVEAGIACGYSTFSLGDENMEQVRARADEMMYQDKKNKK